MKLSPSASVRFLPLRKNAEAQAPQLPNVSSRARSAMVNGHPRDAIYSKSNGRNSKATRLQNDQNPAAENDGPAAQPRRSHRSEQWVVDPFSRSSRRIGATGIAEDIARLGKTRHIADSAASAIDFPLASALYRATAGFAWSATASGRLISPSGFSERRRENIVAAFVFRPVQ